MSKSLDQMTDYELTLALLEALPGARKFANADGTIERHRGDGDTSPYHAITQEIMNRAIWDEFGPVGSEGQYPRESQ